MFGMEETNTDQKNKKSKWYFIMPIIVALIFAGLLFYFDIRKSNKENENHQEIVPVSDYKPQPVSPQENPRRSEELFAGIGCAGPADLKYEVLKQPDAVWEIKKSGETTTVSLGKYRLYAPEKKIFDIPKFWLFFYGEKLGREEDGIFSLESSYVSGMRLIVNGFEQKISLGGDEYMLIELNYPLGDLYPYDRAATLEYEFLIDFKCKKTQNGECVDNQGKSLKYLNGEEVISVLRIFAVGCQEFNSGELAGGDLEISVKFKY